MLAEKTAVLEFEELRQDYAVNNARGIPMSVHERYRNALAEMRRQIRDARNGAKGNRLGDLLVEQGVLNEEKLQQTLAEQVERGKEELLGEVLTTLDLIKGETLISALLTQESEN